MEIQTKHIANAAFVPEAIYEEEVVESKEVYDYEWVAKQI